MALARTKPVSRACASRSEPSREHDGPGARGRDQLRDLPDVEESIFKDVLAAVATPVSVVTTRSNHGKPHGSTVSAFCSLSLRPPLVLVSLDRNSDLLRMIRRRRAFAINVLAEDQGPLAARFARKGDDKFVDVEWTPRLDLPRLSGVRGWIACYLERAMSGGDHMIIVGRVVQADRSTRAPLLYCQSTFGRLSG